MQIAKNKTAAIAIAIFLIASMTASSLMLMPIVSAHTPPQNLATYAYVTAAPSTIGVGQTSTIYMWLNRVYGYTPEDPASIGLAYAAVNNDYRFHKFNLTIIDPNGGVNTTIFQTIQDTTSNQAFSFTPTIAGTYQILFNFPGQAYNSSGGSYNAASVLVDDYYIPVSANATLTAQDSPVYVYPDSYPLPSEYWARPIYGENPFWFTIASNWLGSGSPGYQGFATSYNTGLNGAIFFSGDMIGPQTNHIMWTKPLESGGVVGGNQFEIIGNSYFEGSAYNQRFQNPIIVDGKIFYTSPVSFTGYASGPTVCLDLRTGQQLWSRIDVPSLSLALVWDHEDPNQHGVFPPILATSNFGRLFDAYTGEPLFNVSGVPSPSFGQQASLPSAFAPNGGTPGWQVMGPNGENLRYVFMNLNNATNPNWVLARWNSTKLWNFAYNPYTTGSILSPTIINQTLLGSIYAGAPITDPSIVGLVGTVPIAKTGGSATMSTSTVSTTRTATFTYGSQLVVNGGTGFNMTAQALNTTDPQNRFDFAQPVSWMNTLTGGLTCVFAIRDDVMLCYNGTLPSEGARFMGTIGFNPYRYIAVNLNASNGNIGDILWTKVIQPPAGNVSVLLGGVDPVNRVFVENIRELDSWIGYDLDSGDQIWTTPSQVPLDYYGSQGSASLANAFAYGRMYSAAMGGVLYCYDTSNGDILWTYGNGGPGNSTDSGIQVPGPYPTFVNAIGNDVVYTVTSEHTTEMPIAKGCLTRAVNATTGAEIWTLSSYVTEFMTNSFAIADGYATWFNSYDDQVYTLGRGATSLTVNAPNAGVTLGGSMVITGKVYDVSSGSKQNEQIARFPQGLPVASDASMRDWMAYVYQQKPLADNFTGVDVTVIAVDPNNNYQTLGTATTDATGTYVLQYTPPVEGKYSITATFAGTNGYWPSEATTAFAVDAAAPTQAPVETQPPGQADIYFFPAIAALIVIVIVMGIAVILALRKRA